jgi:hypothetical protein
MSLTDTMTPFQVRTSRLRSWTPCADSNFNPEPLCTADVLTTKP